MFCLHFGVCFVYIREVYFDLYFEMDRRCRDLFVKKNNQNNNQIKIVKFALCVGQLDKLINWEKEKER